MNNWAQVNKQDIFFPYKCSTNFGILLFGPFSCRKFFLDCMLHDIFLSPWVAGIYFQNLPTHPLKNQMVGPLPLAPNSADWSPRLWICCKFDYDITLAPHMKVNCLRFHLTAASSFAFGRSLSVEKVSTNYGCFCNHLWTIYAVFFTWSYIL